MRGTRWLRHVVHGPKLLFRRYRHIVPRGMRRSLMIPLALQLIGTIAYPLIEGPPWTFFDGAYMTAITIATIGYGEVHPLSTEGRIFTIFLAYGGIFTFAYFASEFVRMTVTGELRELLGRERMEEELSQLKGHVIVCGLGRMGKIVCDELERQHKKFVVIERDPIPFAEWNYRYGIKVHGDATEDETLRKAGIERAKALITVVASDADNLYIVLSARLLVPKLAIIARAEEEEAEVKLKKVGASNVISPYLAGGHRAVQAVLQPTVLRVMEMANRPEFADLQIEELIVAEGSAVAGKTLKDTKIASDLHVMISGILKPDGQLIFAPQGDAVLDVGSTIIAMGRRKNLAELEKLVAKGTG